MENSLNEVLNTTTAVTVYDIACNISTMLSVLVFVVMVMFLYKLLKNISYKRK